MSSISLGAAAIVAIDSYAANVTESVTAQSRALLGGDVAFSSRRPLADTAKALMDSLRLSGFDFAQVTNFPSMALVSRTKATRFVQVRAVSSNYPLYGRITTEPESAWAQLHSGAHALVDPSLLVTLDAHIGDTIRLGFGRFEITGTLQSVPGAQEISEILGPRVFIPERYIAETRLLTFGNTAAFRFLGKARSGVNVESVVKPLRLKFASAELNFRTAQENEEEATKAILQLRNFIGIVGLVALLLGGIGVASGVRAFVARKIDTVAILRCLGASSGQVLAMYVAQAGAMGVIGAAFGAALGVGAQFLLPVILSNFLPLDVSVTAEPWIILEGIAIGGWIALLFSLRPLLAIRNISPLQTLRRDPDAEILRTRLRDVARILVDFVLVASVLAIALNRATRLRNGIGMAVATGGVILVLTLSATLLAFLARRTLRRGWPYVVRQGVANLYRPANQTRAVILALGFGSFLITTLYVVQSNLLRQFTVDQAASRANVLFFDVQPDQQPDIEHALTSAHHEIINEAPVVTMRIAEVKGRRSSDILSDTITKTDTATSLRVGRRRVGERGEPRRAGPLPYSLRHEYRSTYRDSVAGGEKIISGKWFSRADLTKQLDTGTVSLEQSIARDLDVKVGDLITWNVQGVSVPTRVGSIREVVWARFEPNFFAVFPSPLLKQAPHQVVILANVSSPAEVTRLQRELVAHYPNISTLDLSLIKESVGRILHKVSVAVRFMALFSLLMGVPVLFSSVAATRRDRIREGVLLKTLGATRGQIVRILFVEYALLGLLGAFTGMLLSIGGGWAIVHWVFENPFSPALGPSALIALLMLAITVTIGLIAGREVYRRTAIEALRDS